jgi:acetyl esterase/lipase
VLRIIIVILISFLLSCGGEAPTDAPDNAPVVELPYEIRRSIVFSGSLELDLYLPTEIPGPYPAIVYIHGGRWSAGERTQFQRQAIHMASNGFVGAAIDHRLVPDDVFPAALQDAKAAVRWLRANADTYNIDPSRIGVAGGSSGGHLAALVGTTEGVAEFEGEGNLAFSSGVQAVAAFNPVLDFVDIWERGDQAGIDVIELLLGASFTDSPDLWTNASPISQVSDVSAPFLLLHGTADQTVPHGQSVDMMNALMEVGVPAELFTADGAGHGFFNDPPWYLPSLEAMEDFFVRMLK